MSHYKSYPAYKDSGVEWLGRVPEHWEITPLKYEAEFVNGAAFKPEQWSEIGTPIIRIENLNGSLNFNCFDGLMDARYHVEQGDLLFGWSGNRGTSFGPFIWPHAGRHYLNQHIFRICNFKFDKAWFYWSLKAVTAHVEDQAHGIIGMVHITKGDLGGIKIATPALSEQQAISAHLDRETARIDALIEKKTRFIELLREKRQALITQAVTKGLDPRVKMKDSGVEWLGEVPVHWSFGRLAYACELIVDGTHHSPESYPEGAFKYITAKNIKEHGFDFTELTYLSADQHQEIYSRCSVKAGDVLYIKDGATAGVAMVNYLEEEFSLLSSVAVIRPKKKRLLSEYLAYLLNSGGFKTSVLSRLVGGAITRFTLEMIGNFSVSLPSIEEQRQVVAHLERIVPRFDVLKVKTERSIELLKERRSALITAAVTGQIDLRQAV